MSTPCTAFVAVSHYLHADDTPILLLSRIEFDHDGGDARTAAIAALRHAYDARDACVSGLLAYDVKEHEWTLAEVSDLLVGRSFPTI